MLSPRTLVRTSRSHFLIRAAPGLVRKGGHQRRVGVEEVIRRAEDVAAALPAASKQRRTSARVCSGVQPVKKWNWSNPPIRHTLSPMRRLASARSTSPPMSGGVKVSMASGPIPAICSRIGIMPPQV